MKEASAYTDDQGVIRCKTCNEALYTTVCGCKGRVMCKCEQAAYEKEESARIEEQRLKAIERRKQNSLLSNRYADVRLADVEITPNNQSFVVKAKNYVANAREAINKNLGIFVCGGNSVGKTYLTSAICNELIEMGYSCLYTNLAAILKQSSYFDEYEDDIKTKIAQYDFVFLDDLGKEFIGRESHADSVKFAESVLFETINARYNAQLPTVFSSNYTIQELSSELSLDQGIMERIVEMSSSVWHLTGDDFRKQERTAKKTIAQKLGI